MFANMEQREKELGFIPQQEIIYNKLLPYADKLDEESQNYLAEIKAGLGNAILHREIIPSTLQWVNHLNHYVKLYGRKFSKEDHLHFIHLLLDLIVIPDLELLSVQKFIGALHSLLKKKELLSRDDLVIPWRPLYDLYERTVNSSYEQYSLLLLPGAYENTLKSLIRSCRHYFTVESTQEMLDEWRPKMCIFEIIMVKVMNYFELFLCTKLPPDQHQYGFKLWLDEFLKLWQMCQSNPVWENSLVWLLARVSRDNVGYINWEPYIPMIFTKFLRGFNLPSSNKPVSCRQANPTEVYPQVIWIVYMLGGGSNSCQLHINRLFKALESYYHPSNIGRWVIKLQRLLLKLPEVLVTRLHRERYKKPTWETPIPKQNHLTDEEITEFVLSLKPVALLSIFSKFGSTESSIALKNLALLRPELIIPPILDRMYSSLETITEPHRLTAAMQCVISIARSLVDSPKYYPEGPSHVVPLLMGAIPGIDQNDFRKCIVTFQLVSIFSSLILFVDASKDVNTIPDLSEAQQELCLTTVAFEDFILQYMDRCFVLIENHKGNHPNGLDRTNERMNTEENIIEMGLSTTYSTLLTQCSPDIYKAALRKLYTFVSNRIFEVKISGKFAANMCRSATKVCPELALPIFIPHFSKLVFALTDNDEVLNEEILDEELLFSLLLLSEVVRCNGTEVLKYRSEIEKVLRRTLHLKCKDGYLLACTLLKHVLKSFTLIAPLDYCSIPDFKERCKNENMYSFVKEWGKPGDINDLRIRYHIPNDEEMKVAQEFMESFLNPELHTLKQWVNNEINLTRDEVYCSLSIISGFVHGTASCLPMWQGEQLPVHDYKAASYSYPTLEYGVKAITTADGGNVRLLIYETVKQVLDNLLDKTEDDVKSVFVIIKIYQLLLFNFGSSKDDFDSKWKAFNIVKKAMKMKLRGHKQHIRALLVDRVCLQHEMRFLDRKSGFTQVHKDMMLDLMKLSVSHYAEVRLRAQTVLQTFFSNSWLYFQWILPDLLKILSKNPSLNHEEFKGALYVIWGSKSQTILTTRSWEYTSQVWPALVSSMHSEKPSVVALVEHILVSIVKYFNTYRLELKVPDSCLELAKKLWSKSRPVPASDPIGNAEIEQSKVKLEERNKINKSLYIGLVETLVEKLQSGSLHWQRYNLACQMLSVLLRYDIKFPACAVRLFINHLIHDTVVIRKHAVGVTVAILRQQKRPHAFREIDLNSISVDDVPLHPLLEAHLGKKKRPSNMWLQYNSLNAPTTQEKWNKSIFVHKSYIGFYAFPKPFLVHAEDDKQPKLNRSPKELTEEELPFYEAFTNPEFIEKWIKFLSLEEKKGQEKLDLKLIDMFQGLFRNFGDTFLPNFWTHVERMANDVMESVNRCAAEIVAGIFRGSKHWNFLMMESLKAKMLPVMKTVLRNVHPETFYVWASCINCLTVGRDPNKYYWFFELILEKPDSEQCGSFLDSSWLHFLRLSLVQQGCRIFELHHRFMAEVMPKMNHSYQNVREKVGSLLGHIFLFDVPLESESLTFAMKRTDFLRTIMPRFAALENGLIESPSVEDKSVNTVQINDVQNHLCSPDSTEKKEAVNLFRSICRWMISNISRTINPAPPEIFQLLLILCSMQSDSADDELQKESIVTSSLLGQSVLSPESISTALAALKDIANNESWHSRMASVVFLQVMVFSNLFSVMHNDQWLQDIAQLVLHHLHDQRVEVREAAGETLGGLLHCEVMKVSEELLSTFRNKCQRKLKRVRAAASDVGKGPMQIEQDEMRERHAGVLGLCACVNAFPYDVPEFMPDVLVILGNHLNDPQPIPSTVKKTLSNFRRTHHDNWRDHQLKFTDDQLAVITDLLVSPSYYA